jgi:hypothetical protein
MDQLLASHKALNETLQKTPLFRDCQVTHCEDLANPARLGSVLGALGMKLPPGQPAHSAELLDLTLQFARRLGVSVPPGYVLGQRLLKNSKAECIRLGELVLALGLHSDRRSAFEGALGQLSPSSAQVMQGVLSRFLREETGGELEEARRRIKELCDEVELGDFGQAFVDRMRTETELNERIELLEMTSLKLKNKLEGKELELQVKRIEISDLNKKIGGLYSLLDGKDLELQQANERIEMLSIQS